MKQKQWMSIYFFYEGGLDNILIQLIKPILNEVTKDDTNQFFFIKYYEGGPHIRLRLKGNSIRLETLIKPIIEFLSKDFFSNRDHSIKNLIKYESYLPEFDRYGGETGVNLAEKLFQLSSELVLKLIDTPAWNYQKAMGSAIQLHFIFLYTFFKDSNDLHCFLEFGQTCWTYSYINIKANKGDNSNEQDISLVKEEMKNLYDKQKDIINAILDANYEKLQNKKPLKNQLLQKWNISVKKFYKEFKLKEDKIIGHVDKLNNIKNHQVKKWMVLDSYLHMTNNRLGVNTKDEGYIYYILKMFFATKNKLTIRPAN